MIKKFPVVSIIVPVYNEEKTIKLVIEELFNIKNYLPIMEILVVDDGSTDKTQEIIRNFSSIRYIKHEKNQGKGAAIRTGIRESSGNVIIIQDADLEYPAKHIPQLVDPILSGEADVVYGSRFRGYYKDMSFLHHIGNRVLSFVTTLLYKNYISDVMTGHKAFSKDVFNNIDLSETGFDIEVELTTKILKYGYKIIEVPIEYSYRCHGTSKIGYLDGVKSFFKLFLYKIKA